MLLPDDLAYIVLWNQGIGRHPEKRPPTLNTIEMKNGETKYYLPAQGIYIEQGIFSTFIPVEDEQVDVIKAGGEVRVEIGNHVVFSVQDGDFIQLPSDPEEELVTYKIYHPLQGTVGTVKIV